LSLLVVSFTVIEPVDQQAVPPVVEIGEVAGQLVLREFVHRRQRVLMQAEGVLART
jgi:hypothetical protein